MAGFARYWRQRLTAAATILGIVMSSQPGLAATSCMRGVNLAGAEFGKPGDAFGKGYVYPSQSTVEYFAKKGFNTVRLPFLWERLQPKLYGPLDKAELKRLQEAVKLIRGQGMKVILDPHNYARYNGVLIGSDKVPESAFTDFWRKLSALFANQGDVIYGLMNEPYGISAQDWLSSANSAIGAIRQTGSKNLILVPGTAWTGAHSWVDGDYGTPNGSVMAAVTDPQNNFAYEVHQYLDEDYSGKHDDCSKAGEALRAIVQFGDWLHKVHRRGFLGEFAVSALPQCQVPLGAIVQTIEQNQDVWLGWSYWAAGDWWPAEEPLNIQPVNGEDKTQLKTLLEAFSDETDCKG